MRRTTWGIGVVLLTALCSSCTSGTGGSSARTTTSRHPPAPSDHSLTATRHFGGKRYGLSFDYPGTWHAAPYTDLPGEFASPIVFVSNATLVPPCTHTHSGATYGISCGHAVKALPPGGILVTWGTVGSLGGPQPPRHPNTTIDNHRAEVAVMPQQGACDQIGGRNLLTAEIRLSSGAHYEMVACARAPDLLQNEARVRRMLRSVHIYA